MAVWTMTQALGYITWIVIDRDNNWIKNTVCGLIFLMFAFFDYFFFSMYPAQNNIFVECAQTLRKEKQIFDKMNSSIKMHH